VARKLVLFDRYDGGEFGSLGAWKAPANSFTASNMLVNRLGELMVRPGLKNISPSGLSTGVVHGFGGVGVPTADLWFVQGTAVHTFSSDATNLRTAAVALAEIPSEPINAKVDTNTALLASTSDKIYRLTPAATPLPTLAALTDSPGANNVAVYGDRIVAGKIDGSFGYRLRFSDAANPNSWPAANFIDIGDGWHISGLFSQRQHLLIVKQAGMYVLTGVPGVNPVLRKVSNRGGGESPFMSFMHPDNTLWYSDGGSHPQSFNGSVTRDYSHLSLGGSLSSGTTNPPVVGITGFTNPALGVMFFRDSGNTAMLNQNGVWTSHTFGVNTTGYTAEHGQYVYLCDGGAVGVAPKFYAFNPSSDTPGIEGGDRMKAGDDSSTALTGTVTFPEWWATDGDEVMVRSVIVDFRTWATGSATTNHFDLAVSALRRYQAGSAQASTTVSFDEAAASSSATGTLQRRIFGFGEQGIGNGFQLAFTNCRGMAIQRIEVILSTQGVRA
jgi:hypothetical protein